MVDKLQNFLSREPQVLHPGQVPPGFLPGHLAPRLPDQGLVLGDEPPAGALGIKESAALQFGKGPLHRVRIHCGLSCQLPDAGQPLPGLVGPGDDAQAELLHQLKPDGPVP